MLNSPSPRFRHSRLRFLVPYIRPRHHPAENGANCTVIWNGVFRVFLATTAMLRRTTVVGQQAMRAFKSKIQATKPKDTTKMVCDGVVVSARGSLLRVPPRTPFPPARLLRPTPLAFCFDTKNHTLPCQP